MGSIVSINVMLTSLGVGWVRGRVCACGAVLGGEGAYICALRDGRSDYFYLIVTADLCA